MIMHRSSALKLNLAQIHSLPKRSWFLTQTREETQDRLHWNAYRFFRQEVKGEIRLAAKMHVRTELHNSKGNSNAIWKVICRCPPSKGVPLKTENPLNLSNKFNAFYSSVGKVTADNEMQLAKQHGFSTSGGDLSCSLQITSMKNTHKSFFPFVR